MTLVLNTPSGRLLQTQINMTDVVTTYHIANSALGWIGGVDAVGNLMENLKMKISDTFTNKTGFEVPASYELLPLAGQIFTPDGPRPFRRESGPGIFGDELDKKVIGLTLCAIAHDCGGQHAVRLFMKCMGPALFTGDEVVRDTVQATLMDSYTKILNEGASRGLTGRFVDAVNALSLPPTDRSWLKANSEANSNPFPLEISMVGGLLKWLTLDRKTKYFTRSSMVARVAVCLKEVGYMVNVGRWDGVEPYQGTSGPAVVLVLGGSSPTDIMMLSDGDEIPQALCLHHYAHSTVGALFSNAAYDQCDTAPETFQNIYEKIHDKIRTHLDYTWSVVPFDERTSSSSIIQISANLKQWNGSLANRSIAIRLASMNFPMLGDRLAFCYEGLDNEAALKDIQSYKSSKPQKTTTKSLIHFRAMTASIVIAMAGRLALHSFDKCHHLTKINLTGDDWLKSMCRELDQLNSSITMRQGALILAAVHAGAEPTAAFKTDSQSVIGWRQGIYAVIPSLLAEMAPTRDAVGLMCVDEFWGNAFVYDDGSVRGGKGSGTFEDINGKLKNIETNSAGVIQSFRSPYLGPPDSKEADMPLYLSIERPMHYNNSRDLSLRGRINGTSVGTVAVEDILEVLLRSFEEAPLCSGHTNRNPVFNIKASTWAEDEHYKPLGGDYNSFISVKGNKSWALFLAGQTTAYNGRIVFGCPDCAGDMVQTGSLLIGFT